MAKREQLRYVIRDGKVYAVEQERRGGPGGLLGQKRNVLRLTSAAEVRDHINRGFDVAVNKGASTAYGKAALSYLEGLGGGTPTRPGAGAARERKNRAAMRESIASGKETVGGKRVDLRPAGTRSVIPLEGEVLPPGAPGDNAGQDLFDAFSQTGSSSGFGGPSAEELATQREQNAIARATALSNLAASLLGERLAERQAQRTAAASLLEKFLPSSLNAGQAQVMGSLLRASPTGGPWPTTQVQVPTGALGPANMGAEEAAALEMAKRIFGMKHGGVVTQEKAKEILRHGEVRGHPLTERQKGFFGARAGGKRLYRAQDGTTTVTPASGLEPILQALVQALAALAGLGGTFGSVPAHINDAINYAIPGPPPQLIVGEGGGTVYLIDDKGELRPFASPSALLGSGFNFNQVKTVPASYIAGFKVGAPITTVYHEPQVPTLAAQTQLGEMAANPRDLFTLLFASKGKKTPEALQGFSTNQAANTVLGFRKGGMIAGLRRAALARYARGGQVHEGPTMVLVGDGAGGMKSGAAEYALLQPGSVVAPRPKGERATVANAARAIAGQIAKTPGAAASLVKRAQGGTTTLPKDVWDALTQIPGLQEIIAGEPVSGLLNLQPTVPFLTEVDALDALRRGDTQMANQILRYVAGLGDAPIVTQSRRYRSPLATNAYDLERLSPVQKGLLSAYLSSLGVPFEDYAEQSQRATASVFGAPTKGVVSLRPRGAF